MAKRQVFFYEIRPPAINNDWQLDVRKMIDALVVLPSARRIRPTQIGGEGSYEFVQVVHQGSHPAIAFVRCRQEGLPMLAKAVDLSPLPLEDDSKLAELTHAVFFDNHIVGAEYNHYGPRMSSLISYLTSTVPGVFPSNGGVTMASLMNPETREAVREAEEIKTVTFNIAPQVAEAAQQSASGDVFDALKLMGNGFGAQRFGFNFGSREGLDKNLVLGLINSAFERELPLTTAMARVRKKDGTLQAINLLRTRIGEERDMALISPQARSIEHQSARTEIVAAFNSLSTSIQAASALWSQELDEGEG